MHKLWRLSALLSLLALGPILAPSRALAQSVTCPITGICAGTVTGSESVVRPIDPSTATVYVVISGGSWSGTIDFLQSGDGGANYIASTATDGSTQSTASNGQWRFPAAGLTNFEVLLSGVTGNASVRINSSTGSAGSGSGGGGSPCTATEGELLFYTSSACTGVPNSTVDPVTGDVTLGAGLTVNSIDGATLSDTSPNDDTGISIYELGQGFINFETVGPDGMLFDATGSDIGGTGTGPIAFGSAGGITAYDNSAVGFLYSEDGGSGIIFDATGAAGLGTGTGPIKFTSAGTMTFDDSALSGGSVLDLDSTTPGVITASTILNAVGGLQQNGNPVATNLTTTANADGAIPLGYSNIDATGGSSGITLTSAALVPDGLPPVTIMKVDPGVGPVNISGTINGDAGGYSLTVQWQYVTLYGNGSALFVKGNN